MKVLLTGAGGLLGSMFADRLGEAAIAVPREELAVTNPAAVRTAVLRSGADVVINCAAHVDPEVVEDDPDPAYAANAILPGLLGSACRRADMPLVHFSSTGCYGAWKTIPYTEEDAPRPTTVHHRSKVAGERAVREAGCEHLILRTGWLFGGGAAHKKNFVWKRLQEAAGTQRLLSDAEQFGNPTYAGDVVDLTIRLLRLGLTGTFNCVGRGHASRYEYVARILLAGGLERELVPVRAFKRRAPVSPNEMATNYRLGLMGLDLMPEWGASLDGYVRQVRTWPEWPALFDAGVVT